LKSKHIENIKHLSVSKLVLNKSLFESFALISGLGGVYYTLFEFGNSALIMDTISVITAIVAIIIGIEHLSYVETHQLAKYFVLFAGFVIFTLIIVFVWYYGFTFLDIAN